MNKVVLVTGSSKGLGKELIRLLTEDYEVIIHYHNSYEEALSLKEEIDNLYNRDTMIVKCDLSNEEEIDKMIDTIYDKYDNIYGLINNAGIAIDTCFEDKTKDNFM